MKHTPPRVTLDTPIGADADLDAEEIITATGHQLNRLFTGPSPLPVSVR